LLLPYREALIAAIDMGRMHLICIIHGHQYWHCIASREMKCSFVSQQHTNAYAHTPGVGQHDDVKRKERTEEMIRNKDVLLPRLGQIRIRKSTAV